LTTPGFEVLDHTADAGIVAHGRTLAEAFEQTARGMYSLLVPLDTVRETEVRGIELREENLERLLIGWLTDLLFLTETESLLFRRFEVEIAEGKLAGRAHGERMDEERHEVSGQIKGVTRHLLEVTSEDGGYRTRVLFDL